MNRIGKSNGRLQTKVESLLARRQLKTFMKKTAFGMSCIAVFCVVYALVAPALTVEWPPKCGLEEHTHTDECYGTVIPVEMNCTVSAEDADIIIHEHDEFCYDGNGNLICELPEVKAHTHDETCYILVPTVDLEEENGSDDNNAADSSTDMTDDTIGNDAVTDNTDITDNKNNDADNAQDGSNGAEDIDKTDVNDSQNAHDTDVQGNPEPQGG